MNTTFVSTDKTPILRYDSHGKVKLSPSSVQKARVILDWSLVAVTLSE